MKLDIRFAGRKALPKTIPFHSIRTFSVCDLFPKRICRVGISIQIAYQGYCGDRIIVPPECDIGIVFAETVDIDLENHTVLIYGKGGEREILRFCNREVLSGCIYIRRLSGRILRAAGYFL